MKQQKEMEQLEKNQREQVDKLDKFNEQVRNRDARTTGTASTPPSGEPSHTPSGLRNIRYRIVQSPSFVSKERTEGLRVLDLRL